MDVRENTTGRDRDGAEELGKLFVVADRELDVARHDARLLVVAGRVAGEFKHFRGQVDRGAGTNTGGEFANLEVSVYG